MRLPESVTKIQPVGAVLKASEAGEALLREAGERVNARLPAPEGMAALREAIARQKGAHLTVTAVPCAALTLDRAEALHGGALELAWGEIAEG